MAIPQFPGEKKGHMALSARASAHYHRYSELEPEALRHVCPDPQGE